MFSTKGLHLIDKRDILKKITIEDLWIHYTGLEIQLKKMFLSPLRNEKRPSAGFFYGKELILKDFGEGSRAYTIWDFLMKRFNLTYREVLNKVYDDLISNKDRVDIEYYGDRVVRRIRENKKIIPYFKEFSKEELDYWNSYHINKKTLDLFNIRSLSYYWLVGEDYSIKVNCIFSFAYLFGNNEYKIYSPFDKDHKWYTNAPIDTLQGEHILPWLDDTLIITKALKDVMVLYEAGFNSIGLQGENSFPSELKMKTFIHRFKNIVVLFDNDKAGINGAITFSKMYNFKYFFLDESKDISDYSKNNNLNKVKGLICLKLDKLLE